ncbi:MAG: helix-turn-helix transcriptional regulator [Caldilineaceae bacterium]
MKIVGIENLGELAEKIGVRQDTFSSWLSGRWNPSFENLENLCRVLECTADDIMAYDRPKAMALAAM